MKGTDNAIFRLLARLGLLFAFAQPAFAQEAGQFFLQTPHPIPHALFTDSNGKKHSLEEVKGKKVIVHFWASWCPPCRKELPELAALPNKNVVIIPASLDRYSETVEIFYARQKLRLPVLMDENGEAMRAFGFKGLPASVLLDENGNIIAIHEGPVAWESETVQKIVGE